MIQLDCSLLFIRRGWIKSLGSVAGLLSFHTGLTTPAEGVSWRKTSNEPVPRPFWNELLCLFPLPVVASSQRKMTERNDSLNASMCAGYALPIICFWLGNFAYKKRQSCWLNSNTFSCSQKQELLWRHIILAHLNWEAFPSPKMILNRPLFRHHAIWRASYEKKSQNTLLPKVGDFLDIQFTTKNSTLNFNLLLWSTNCRGLN